MQDCVVAEEQDAEIEFELLERDGWPVATGEPGFLHSRLFSSFIDFIVHGTDNLNVGAEVLG